MPTEQELVSPTGIQDVAADPSPAIQDVDEASSASDVIEVSSTSQEEATPEPDLLSVVRNAVEKPKPEDETDPDPDPEVKADPEAPEPDAKAVEEEDGKDLPFGKHPRFQALVAKSRRLQTEVQELQEPARQHRQIVDFMRQNDLSDEHMVELFRVGALMRRDPEKAYEAVAEYLLELGRITGRTLPDDLAEDIEYGRISEQRAEELSRERARAARLEQSQREQAERAQAQQFQSSRQNVQRAVADWETQARASDPDYKAKEKLIADRVQVLAASLGVPRTTEEAVGLVSRAHKEVSDELRAVLPRRQPVKAPLQSSGSAAAATTAPKTLLEAVTAAVQQTQ